MGEGEWVKLARLATALLQLAPYPKADGSTCGFVYSKLKIHDVSVNAREVR